MSEMVAKETLGAQVQSATEQTYFPQWKLLRNIFGFITFMVAFLVYALTAQPTVSFWDCGEFISCSYILGVPHPPGAPLVLLLGRLVSLLPLGVEVARKINWMSSFFNALAVMMIYFALARIVNRWFGNVKNWTEAFIAIVGATAGALFAGLNTTFWNNGVEAEVYAIAMFFTTTIVYLAILWSERHKDPKADRYIILIAYLLYLGVGAHLTTLIMLPPIFLFFIIADKEKRKNPVFWLTWFVLFLLGTEFNIFVENFMTALIVFFLAAVLTNSTGGRSVFLAITGLWTLVQLGLIPKGTTLPGLIFGKYGLSGTDPNVVGAIFQFIILLTSFLVVLFKNYIVEWRKGFITILVATIAFLLVPSYTLIRSRANPYIDENDPETISALRDYMDRKQYGQESLWVLMFHRKGSWASQFGTHRRMGFWGFFRDEWADPKDIPRKYTLNGWLYFILAYLGLAYAAYRNPKWGSLLFFATLISTIGLLIYLNFSDGTRGIHLEVRDRDYFYTPGFMFMGALMGLGLAAILTFIYKGFRDILMFLKKIGPVMFITLSFGALIIMGLVKQDVPYFLGTAVVSFILGILCTFIKHEPKKELSHAQTGARSAVVFILGLIFLLLPAISPATYWFENDRSRNYIPFDYAYNILDSVDKNGIIFTNGDNDTFPLWFLQAVPHIRDDVRIVNLSLLNTPWYIKQIKRMGVPIKFTDEEIERLRPRMDPTTGKLVRVQDIMVEHIINNTPVKMKVNPETGETTYVLDPPVFFAVTVAPENKVGYDPYLIMEGLVYRVLTTKDHPQVDIEKMRHNIIEKYKYRGLNDTTIYKDENSRKLLQNYTTGFITLAYEYRKKGDTTNAIEIIDKMNEFLPFEWRANSFSAEFYSWAGKWDKVDSLYEVALHHIQKEHPLERSPDEAKLFQMYFEIYYRNHKYDKARRALEDGMKIFPDDKQLFQAYIGFLYKIRDAKTLKEALAKWVEKHPEDRQFAQFYEQVKSGALEQMWKQEDTQKQDTGNQTDTTKPEKQ